MSHTRRNSVTHNHRFSFISLPVKHFPGLAVSQFAGALPLCPIVPANTIILTGLRGKINSSCSGLASFFFSCLFNHTAHFKLTVFKLNFFICYGIFFRTHSLLLT